MENFPNYPPAVQQAILDGPAMVPPNGTIPDFDDPPNSNSLGIGIGVMCLFLGTTTFFLRVYSRIFIVKKLQIEDFLCIASFGCYVGFASLYWWFLNTPGFFVHQWNVAVKDMFRIGQVLLALPIVYGVTMLFLKTAILLEWTRIFVPKGTRNYFYWGCRLLMILNILLYLSALITYFTACIPLQKVWYTWVDGKCINRKTLDTAAGVFNLVTDLLILLLPQRVIWVLKMTRARKLGISFVFSVGLLACVCAAGRTAATITLTYQSTGSKAEGDTTHEVTKIFLWSLAETTCVLMVLCVPSVPKAFAEPGMLFKVASSMRSWRLLPSAKRSRQTSARNGGKPAWPPTIGSAPGTRVYRMIDEDGQAMNLAELELMRNGNTHSGKSN